MEVPTPRPATSPPATPANQPAAGVARPPSANAGRFDWFIPEDRVVWSSELESLYGVPAGTFEGRFEDWSRRVVPEDAAQVVAAVERCLTERIEAISFEFRAILPDGGTRWMSGQGSFSYDDAGKPLRMRGINVDIDDRVRDQARDRFLVGLDDQVRPLVDPDAVVATCARALGEHLGVDRCAYAEVEADRDSMYLSGNYTRGDVPSIVGRLKFSAFGPQALDLMRENRPYVVRDVDHHQPPIPDLAAYRQTQIQAVVCVPLHKDGRLVAAMAVHSTTPRAWRPDEVELVRRVADRCWESIERARVARSLRETAVEAERLGRMKDEFLATLSHELRTPLNAISGWAQLLHRGALGPTEQRTAAETIARNARAQTRMIEDLLDMSHIVSGKVRLDVQRADLVKVVAETVQSVRPAADGRRVRVEQILDPLAGPVNGDPGRLQQMLWNLLSNAIKFTSPGGKVQVVLERVNSHLEVSVSDTGVGIKPAFLPFVFDRFSQSDSSTTRQFGGLGIGLSVVKQLAELHGGTVRAKSPGEGRGSTFIVSLPLAVTHEGDVAGRVHPAASAGTSDEPLADEPSLRGLRVLVVDDDADGRTLVRRVLEDREASVLVASGAAEALRIVEAERPDVMLSDLGMPDVDGYELIRRVRSLGADRGGAMIAIALTAFARTEDRRRALLAGFSSHVAKPVDAGELVAVIASLTGRTGIGG